MGSLPLLVFGSFYLVTSLSDSDNSGDKGGATLAVAAEEDACMKVPLPKHSLTLNILQLTDVFSWLVSSLLDPVPSLAQHGKDHGSVAALEQEVLGRLAAVCQVSLQYMQKFCCSAFKP